MIRQSVAVDLRPLTTSELIDRGFALYRAHFAGFLLLALICQSVPLLGQVLMTSLKIAPTPNELMGDQNALLAQAKGPVFIWVGVWLASVLFYYCFDVVLIYFISDAYLGKTPSVLDCMRRFGSRVGATVSTYMLTMLATGLSLLFPLIALVAVLVFGKVFAPPNLALLLLFFGGALLVLIASVVPVLAVVMRLWLTIPAVALEGLSGWQAIKRSSTLVRYDPGLGILYWGEMRLSFLLLPLFVIELLTLSLTSLPLVLFQINEVFRHGGAGQIAQPPDSAIILSQVLTFLAGALILPLYSIATTLFYYDVRIRREGFDMEFMARQLGENK